MKPWSRFQQNNFYTNVSEGTPIGIKQKFEALDKIEKEIKENFDNISQLAKEVYFYMEKSMNLRKKVKEPKDLQLYRMLQNISELYHSRSLLGYVLNIFSENGIARCETTTSNINDMSELIMNPLQDIIKSYSVLSKFKVKLMEMHAELEAVKNRLKHGTRSTTNKESEHPQIRLFNLSNQLEQYQGKVLGIYKEYSLKERDCLLNSYETMECEFYYHSACYEEVNKNLDTVRRRIENTFNPRVFGISLKEHLSTLNSDIAVVIHDAISWIMSNGLEEEGIFRLPGNKTKMAKLRAAYDAGIRITIDFIPSIHIMCGVLKEYIRELPESLLFPNIAIDEIDHLLKLKDQELFNKMYEHIHNLPRHFYLNVRYFFKFLNQVSSRSKKNLMSSQNIGLVFGPTLLSMLKEEDRMLSLSMCSASVVATIIDRFDQYFPEDCLLKCTEYFRIVLDQPSTEGVRVLGDITQDVKINNPADHPSNLADEQNENKFVPPYHFTNSYAYNLLGI